MKRLIQTTLKLTICSCTHYVRVTYLLTRLVIFFSGDNGVDYTVSGGNSNSRQERRQRLHLVMSGCLEAA